MFDIGFSELFLVGLVALVVLGPERLPGAVRTTSLWIGRLKRSFLAIKQDVERELGADEIRRQLHNDKILELEREMQAVKHDLLTPPDATPAAPTSTPDTLTPGAPPTPAPTSQDKPQQP